MSAQPHPILQSLVPHRLQAETARTRTLSVPRHLESVAVFVLAAAFFTAVGVYTTVHLHVIYGDAESRMTKAYLVWWNRPGKLASIGFLWPPLQTLALLPFTLIKPLATSLVALPLFAGLCGGVLIMVLNRTLTLLSVARGYRYTLLLVFAVNPMFLDYAGNGMAEILSMMLLTLGFHFFVKWYVSNDFSTRAILTSGLFMGFGFMSRYELGVWMAWMMVGIIYLARRKGVRYSQIEATLLLFLAPAVYMTVIWAGLSAAVIGGGPLAWLTRASDGNHGNALPYSSLPHIFMDAAELGGRISLLIWAVPVGLAVLAVVRRQRFAAFLAVAILLQVGITFVLVGHHPYNGLYQLRFQMRSLPLTMVGAGWLLRSIPMPSLRFVTWAAICAVGVIGIPVTLHAMKTYPYQFDDQAFARALTDGTDQAGTYSIGNYLIGDPGIPAAARWVNSHITQPKRVLIDDGASPGILLESGRPDLFVTRVDHGDKAFNRILRHPWGKVAYALVVSTTNAGFSSDEVAAAYPTSRTGVFPGGTLVFHNHDIWIYRLDAVKPAGVG